MISFITRYNFSIKILSFGLLAAGAAVVFSSIQPNSDPLTIFFDLRVWLDRYISIMSFSQKKRSPGMNLDDRFGLESNCRF